MRIREKRGLGSWVVTACYAVPTTIVLLIGKNLVEINRFGAAFFLVILAVSGYFFCVTTVAKNNWMDIRAVFHGVWVGTIGLAALRLLDYQEVWQNKTWLCLAGAYLVFQIGASIGIEYSHRTLERISLFFLERRFGKVSLKTQGKRLFWICIITTLIGFLCFFVNVLIKGHIPCFSSDVNAYLKFYTKFHVFAVAATNISGLCYYCVKTQKLSGIKKLMLWLCILYSTFLFPLAVVSRGTFIVSALSLTVMVFYLNGRKFWVLIVCLLLIVSIYFFGSVLRAYTNAQLEEFFEPSSIDLPEKHPNEGVTGTTPVATTFSLHPKVAFFYGYLTVSHDNFNEAVENTKGYTYGAKMLAPFNVILRNQTLNHFLENAENYLVRPHLNTANIVSDFYYDFHEWGVLICMLFWSVVFGAMQCCAMVYKGSFSLLVLGNAMTPVALCFFSSWLSNFTLWMNWGTILILAFMACLSFERCRS